MNYRQKIRRAIECPQFGNAGYGEWGILTLEQRRLIKRLLDELDSADNFIKRIYIKKQKENEKLIKLLELKDRTIKEKDDIINMLNKDITRFKNEKDI